MHFPDYYVKYYVVQKRLTITITLLLEQEYHVKHLQTRELSTLLHSSLKIALPTETRSTLNVRSCCCLYSTTNPLMYTSKYCIFQIELIGLTVDTKTFIFSLTHVHVSDSTCTMLNQTNKQLQLTLWLSKEVSLEELHDTILLMIRVLYLTEHSEALNASNIHGHRSNYPIHGHRSKCHMHGHRSNCPHTWSQK